MTPVSFPFSTYWSFYLAFIVFVLCMLALDLGVFHRKAHAVKWREALSWSVVWVSLALLFNIGLYYYSLAHFGDAVLAKKIGLEFLTGYLVEKSLAVDNIFVFVLVFSYFAIPEKYQHRVLFYGILGALVFRIIFIALGSVLMQYHAVVLLFGVFLIITGIKVMWAKEKPLNPDANFIIRTLKKVFPVTHVLHEEKFFVRQSGRIFMTPLFVALIFLEVSDIIFAVDSVPAIFGITKEPFLVLTSNIFAILGLRSMYFLLAGAIQKLSLLKYGLGLILIFVGLKMTWLNNAFDGKFPIHWSLGIIAGILFITVIASLIKNKIESKHLEDGPSSSNKN